MKTRVCNPVYLEKSLYSTAQRAIACSNIMTNYLTNSPLSINYAIMLLKASRHNQAHSRRGLWYHKAQQSRIHCYL